MEEAVDMAAVDRCDDIRGSAFDRGTLEWDR